MDSIVTNARKMQVPLAKKKVAGIKPAPFSIKRLDQKLVRRAQEAITVGD